MGVRLDRHYHANGSRPAWPARPVGAARTAPAARAARRRVVLTLLFSMVVGGLSLGLTAGSGGPGSALAAAPGQEDSTTTRPEILVPGPTVASTTTVAAPTTTTEASSSLGRWARDMLADETGRTVAIAIAGLLVVAVLLAILTVRYWRRTRPVRAEVPAGSRPGRPR